MKKERSATVELSSPSLIDRMSMQTMIEVIAKAGYEVRKIERNGG